MAYRESDVTVIQFSSNGTRLGETSDIEVRDMVEVNTIDGGTIWVEAAPQPPPPPQPYHFEITDDTWEMVTNWGQTADPELDDLKNRIREFYQWLKQEAKEIEREEPEATPCVDFVVREMEETFPEIIGYRRELESTEYFDCSVTRYTGAAEFENLVAYGGSTVENFREHG